MERQFSERQLIRWAIPGWVTLFLAILLLSVHFWLNNEFASSDESLLKAGAGTIAALGAAFIVFGFALGYMLFQLYFFLYWGPRPELIGGRVDYQEVFSKLICWQPNFDKQLDESRAEPENDRAKRQKWEVSVAAAWWHCVARRKKHGMVWEDRNGYLVAVYHSLGSTLAGAYLTIIVYLITVIKVFVNGERGIWYFIAVSVNLIILLCWCLILHKTRSC